MPGSSKASALRERFRTSPIIRIVGAHNGLGARLVERHRFEGVWASGFELATAHAVPDAGVLTMAEHLAAAHVINKATTLPVVCDCETGFGDAASVGNMVAAYEAAGLAAAVIEDVKPPKINSFMPDRHALVSIEEFVGKIIAAKSAQRDPDFMLFARLEALITGAGMDEAIRRASAYQAAGADGIVIHSKSSAPDEIFEFADRWQGAVPLICIPTTYYTVTTNALAKHGVRMVIYANQGLRAAVRAMNAAMAAIASSGSTAAIENNLASLDEVFELQGMSRLQDTEQPLSRSQPSCSPQHNSCRH